MNLFSTSELLFILIAIALVIFGKKIPNLFRNKQLQHIKSHKPVKVVNYRDLMAYRNLDKFN